MVVIKKSDFMKTKRKLVRKLDSHKGQNGRVLVVGGSKEFVGAVGLAGIAALRTGSDLVSIAAPSNVSWALNKFSLDLITHKFKGDYLNVSHTKKILTLIQNCDVVLIGPGLGLRSGKSVGKTLVKNLLKNKSCLGVIDADAIKLVKLDLICDCVITPHRTEFEILLKNSGKTVLLEEIKDRKNSLKLAKLIQVRLRDFFGLGNVILLKGQIDLIISKNQILVNKGGNPGMTVGGSGDILAGICAGFISQTEDLFMSAGLASYECKKIGDLLFKKTGYGLGFVASDFINEIKQLKLRSVKSKKIQAKSYIKSNLVKSKLVKSKLVKSKLVKSKLVKSKLIKPKSVKSKLVKPKLVKSTKRRVKK
ncbi:NAD(P)H-hydrate dehydratase [Candidatus Woesearchaeota archaeon]|jgi:ADP-dependent NAD(P)H-hydrate dehydratase / NAD(P)H-hydrate epimerase|nr:NAD(P)H-hydrate dehydratase [Candidatus Woesearchaeota archaeon]